MLRPALLTSTWISAYSSRTRRANSRTESNDARSRGCTKTASPPWARIRAAAASALSRERHAKITVYSYVTANARAVSNPRPVLLPVTIATRRFWMEEDGGGRGCSSAAAAPCDLKEELSRQRVEDRNRPDGGQGGQRIIRSS